MNLAFFTVEPSVKHVYFRRKHIFLSVKYPHSYETIPSIYLQPGEPTVASVLKKADYKTACIGKWGVGTPDNLNNPNDVGFDEFYGYVNMWHAHNFYPEFLVRIGEVAPLKNVAAAKWAEFQDPASLKNGQGVAEKKVECWGRWRSGAVLRKFFTQIRK